MGNAKSLKGGTLIATPLRGADGEIYALAQGNLVVGGAGAAAGGSKVQINHLSAGRVPNGAQVERACRRRCSTATRVNLGLNASDFQTARRVAQAIDRKLGRRHRPRARRPHGAGARADRCQRARQLHRRAGRAARSSRPRRRPRW